METADRIKLCEAMGRLEIGLSGGAYRITADDGTRVTCWTLDDALKYLPDPFTDANNDYAVLKWVRENLDDVAYALAMLELVVEQGGDTGDSYPKYRIGNYARAALKVLE